MNKTGKVMIVTAITLSMLMSGCMNEDDKASDVLINHMTQNELDNAVKTDFQLLDEPWQEAANNNDDPFDIYNHMVGIEIWDHEDFINDYNTSEYYTDEEREEYIAEVYAEPSAYDNKIESVIVNGQLYYNFLPSPDYDGGAGSVYILDYDPDTERDFGETLEFSSYEEFKTLLRATLDTLVSDGFRAQETADRDFDNYVLLMDGIIDGTVEILEPGTAVSYRDHLREKIASSGDEFYWEFDEHEVELIKDNISEYHMYDEELDMRFAVHVTTPPGYDPQVHYPAYVMTDAVWRFDDVAALYNAMATGEAEPMIMVTIGFDYDLDSWSNELRGYIFCERQKEFLDFITDNMMPYLDEIYGFDHDRSIFFGHSQGGVFSHYAAFNYDLYENRPFGRYIIASPAFWTPFFVDCPGFTRYKNEYGYFERNETYPNALFIAAGEHEDSDYEDYYNGNDSTLEGVQNLTDRLTAHGVTSFEVKMYDSHHFQYVGQLLLDYAREMMDK
ncbi:MAG: hypothetical protein IKE53_02865 [Clostridiales bacterium]|nr:hypothetical protein [Clostridiales bacterium]